MARAKASDRIPISFDGVPTLEGLVRLGLAVRDQNGIRVLDSGHAHLGQLLRERGRQATGEPHGVHYQPDIVYAQPWG